MDSALCIAQLELRKGRDKKTDQQILQHRYTPFSHLGSYPGQMPKSADLISVQMRSRSRALRSARSAAIPAREDLGPRIQRRIRARVFRQQTQRRTIRCRRPRSLNDLRGNGRPQQKVQEFMGQFAPPAFP